MRIDKMMELTDCVAVDKAYPPRWTEILALQDHNQQLGQDNLKAALYKLPNTNFTEQESQYNAAVSGFRASVENVFALLSDTFERLGPNYYKFPKDAHRKYNAELKLAMVLLNCKLAVKVLNLEVQDHHKAWMQPDFEYPSSTQAPITAPRVIEQIASLTRMEQVQNEWIEQYMQGTGSTNLTNNSSIPPFTPNYDDMDITRDLGAEFDTVEQQTVPVSTEGPSQVHDVVNEDSDDLVESTTIQPSTPVSQVRAQQNDDTEGIDSEQVETEAIETEAIETDNERPAKRARTQNPKYTDSNFIMTTPAEAAPAKAVRRK